MYGGWPWGRRGVGFCKILARISSRFSSMKTNKGVLVYRYLFEWGIPPFGLMLFSVRLLLCHQPATIGQWEYSHFQEVPPFGITPFTIMSERRYAKWDTPPLSRDRIQFRNSYLA